MRLGLLALLMAALGITIVGVAPAPGHRDDQAHLAAVKYRRQRDHIQMLLTIRVVEVKDLRRSLVSRPSSVEALHLAAVVYGVGYGLLYRIASCESTGGHGLKADADNPTSTAAGLGQFLDTTWAGTPFHAFSAYSPYAAALAMGREISLGHLWQWAASRGCWA